MMDQQQAKRRSSMTVLRNIPSSELANIVSGNSPNPILDVPTSTNSPITTPLLSTALTSDPMEAISPTTTTTTTSTTVDPSITNTMAYQHSLQSFLRRQLSSKRKSRRPRSSSNVSVDPFQPSASSSTSSYSLDADKDIVEISLDDGEKTRHRMESQQKLLASSPSSSSASVTKLDGLYNDQSNESNDNKSSLYPALLLDTPLSSVHDSTTTNTDHHFHIFNGSPLSQRFVHLSTPPLVTSTTLSSSLNVFGGQPSNLVTSAPELSSWEENKEYDYFNSPNRVTNDDESK